MDLDIVGLKLHRQSRAASYERIDERAQDVEIRDRITELIILRGLQLDRAFANLFGESFSAFVIGADAVYRVASEKLRGD